MASAKTMKRLSMVLILRVDDRFGVCPRPGLEGDARDGGRPLAEAVSAGRGPEKVALHGSPHQNLTSA